MTEAIIHKSWCGSQYGTYHPCNCGAKPIEVVAHTPVVGRMSFGDNMPAAEQAWDDTDFIAINREEAKCLHEWMMNRVGYISYEKDSGVHLFLKKLRDFVEGDDAKGYGSRSATRGSSTVGSSTDSGSDVRGSGDSQQQGSLESSGERIGAGRGTEPGV